MGVDCRLLWELRFQFRKGELIAVRRMGRCTQKGFHGAELVGILKLVVRCFVAVFSVFRSKRFGGSFVAVGGVGWFAILSCLLRQR